MVYPPIDDTRKQAWVDFLTFLSRRLEGMEEIKENPIFGTDEGDIATAKDLVGNFLATLTNETITIR